MGHESPIEPWLAPDNRAACGLRTDWLRRAKVMKTTGKENQKRCENAAASRDRGTEGSNNPAQTRWAGRQEKIQPRESCFFLDSFYRTNQASESESVNTSAFMGTNPENEAQPKVNECIALNGPSGLPFIESAHDLHEPASHQNDRAPQYEGNAIE